MIDGLALSALDWWAEAGVDTIVDDVPHDWLASIKPAAAEPAPAGASAARSPRAPAAAPLALPDTLTDFRRWLLSDPAVPGPAAARIDASGDPATGTMIVLDMPEQGDRAAGALLSGEVGALFDRMLGAMKLERSAVYLAPFSPARPAAGRLSERDCAALLPLMRHHIALARPGRLLLLGEAPIRALLGLSLPQARGEARTIAAEGLSVPAIASCHPRYVHAKPDLYRKPAWADLQLFMALSA